jgi:hypothetical protein
VVNNYTTHKHTVVNAWLVQQPRLPFISRRLRRPGSIWSSGSCRVNAGAHPARRLQERQ